MYLRFVVDEIDLRTGAERGIFGPAVDIKYDCLPAPDWIRDEVTREVDWFNEHLDAPLWLGRPGGRHGVMWGICWFRDRAREAIARARYLAWLLTEVGHPVIEMHRDDPGQILWHDHQQVVAKPPRGLPRMFG